MVIFSDNTQVVSMVNKGISSNVDCMALLRKMFWIIAKHNIYLKSRHIPGHHIHLPDLLFRDYVENAIQH